MLRRASLTVLLVVLLPATVHAFDHHHSSGHSGGGGCSSSHASTSTSTPSTGTVTAKRPASTGKRVFITSTTYSGALGSLDAADLHCQSSASAAGLTGTYRAYLSDGSANAFDRITGDGPWTTTGGGVAFASKLDLRGAPASVILSEKGVDVLAAGASGPWTGSDADGVATDQDCEGWTNASGELSATLGTALKDDTDWGGGGQAAACNAKAPLICFEVP
jgi:hypothetical protein